MAGLQFNYKYVKGEFDKKIKEIEQPLAKAAAATMNEAGKIVKAEAAEAIAGAGLSGRWQRGFRYEVLPKQSTPTINSSVHFFHRIGFFNVFEEGKAIAGKPLLWLPLPSVPLGVGRKPLTPRQYVERIGPLRSARKAGGKPMLVGKGTRAGILRATAKAVRVRKRTGFAGAFLGVNVPLFIGVPIVNIRKRLDITSIVQRVGARIGEIFSKNAKPE